MSLSRPRKIAFRSASVLMGMLLVFLAGEIFLRAVYIADQKKGGGLQERLEHSARRTVKDGGADYNMSGLVQPSPYRDIVYEPKPNLDGRFLGQPMRINSLGFRGPEVEMEKPPNTYRIVGLGDSVMFGWGVGQDDFYLRVLERRLNELPGETRRFETLNFGVPGYNTAMEVEVLEKKALAFKPDLVMVQFINNDLGLPIFMMPPKNYWSLKQSFLFDMVRMRFDWIAREKGVNTRSARLFGDRHMHDWDEEEVKQTQGQYRHLTGGIAAKAAFQKLKTLAVEHAFDVMVMKGSIDPGLDRLLEEICREHGFLLFSSGPYTEAFLKHRGMPIDKESRRKAIRVSPTDHHPNALGHLIYTDALLDQMARKGIVDFKLPYDEQLSFSED